MKTKEQILQAVKDGKKSSCLDQRDFHRLVCFFPVSEWPWFDLGLTEGATAPKVEELSPENVLRHLQSDLSFAFSKALNKRGISSSFMFEVISMWMWVLDDPLADWGEEHYSMYGLPLYKAVAIKYELPNPIGVDSGSEDKYNEEN
jgi:hypothetical protein